MSRKSIKALTCGFTASAVMFVLGFGVMGTFWRLGSYDSGVPGYYDYMAATWGDGLFLSMGAGGFCALRILQGPLPHSQRVVCWVFGVVALLFGVAVQISWLLDPNIALNWTIPQPGAFNAAGAYHALYFACCFGFFGYQAAASFVGRPEGDPSVASAACRLVVWMGLSGYLQMHLLDDWSFLAPRSELAFFGICLTLVLATALSLRRRSADSLAFGASGSLAAMGLTLAIGNGFPLGLPARFLPLRWDS